MARRDWVSVGLKLHLAEAIDKFVESESAKFDIDSRQDFINMLVNDFFDKYKDATGRDFRGRVELKNLWDLVERRKRAGQTTEHS